MKKADAIAGSALFLFVLCAFVFLLIPRDKVLRSESRALRSERSASSTAGQGREQTLRKCLSYLQNSVPEVAWVEVENNNIYIGFSRLPSDWQTVTKGAALNGNKAIGFGCHAWAVDAKYRGWRPGDGSYYGEFTARHGRIEG